MKRELNNLFDILLKNDILPSSELLDLIYKDILKIEEVIDIINLLKNMDIEKNIVILDYVKINLIKKQENDINWREIDRLKVLLEKNKNNKLFFSLIKGFLGEEINNFYKKIIDEKKNKIETKLNGKEVEEEKKEEIKIVPIEEKKELLLNGKKMFEELKTDEKIKEIFKKKVTVEYNKNYEKWVEKDIKILKNYDGKPKKIELMDFLQYFKNKYNTIKNFLINRKDVNENLMSINSLEEGKKSTIIVMLRELRFDENSFNLIVEDLTGEVKAIINLNKNPKLKEKSHYLIPDDVVALQGVLKNKVFYVENIIFPDIPNTNIKWLKDEDIKEDIYAIILSDIHVGSKLFLENRFNKLIEWLNGKNNKIYKKIGYVIITGDLVDGIGIYSEQKDELEITSAVKQYEKFAQLIEKIPSEMEVIISPGNHDALRIVEPQPVLSKEISDNLKEMSNVHLVSNPSWILLNDFIKVLIYHGYSYDYFINEIDHLKGILSYDNISKLMAFLLQKRHLVPTYGASPIFPEKDDFLVIKDIPNMMVSGHVHKSSIGEYKGIKLLSSSCWQGKTPFQERVGHNPDPGKVPIINLKDGKYGLLEF